MEISKNFDKVVLIENNYGGQLGNLIKIACGFDFNDKLLKYSGRPFFLEDILDYLNYGQKMSNPLTNLLK